MGPFEVSANDVQQLDDDQLRELLCLLLEAEARSRGISVANVFVGGDQNASDGGVDGRVEWKGDPAPEGWFPCRKTLFQSKAENMPPADLGKELAPRKVVRPFFRDLARSKGAYVVFSTGNCSEAMYRRRIDAMKVAVKGVPGSSNISFEFLDASRIARWANSFHGVANQVRSFVGRPMAGWQPFGNWSAPEIENNPEYILDDRPKVTIGGGDPITIDEAIRHVRERLRGSQAVIRLVGLSGVGKTRFAQALFDDRIDKRALNPALVVYGDLSQSPTISPAQVAEQLVWSQREAILIIDNCPGETHRAVTKIIQRPDSRVHLLSIDFDVGDDQPDNTQVIHLHKNGEELIDSLLVSRMPTLSAQDRWRVVEFSDGNARVALAIAKNHSGGSGLAKLTDQELIDRLFLEGRRPTDDTLRRCAEVASLVYAFHVEQEGEQTPEHPVLAELAEATPTTFFRQIAECLDRGTAQKRGTQRAILPHALAIKLALRALDRLPMETVMEAFTQDRQQRLFRSFTRRLGDLHESRTAQKIAQHLLASDGRLGDLTTFSDEEFTLFNNIAPIIPERALTVLENAVNGPKRGTIVSPEHPQNRLLLCLARNLAYEASLFDRAANVLLVFAQGEIDRDERALERSNFVELFWIALSGTQAPPEQRFRFIDELLANGDGTEKRIAVSALDFALDTGSKTSSHNFKFGSRGRGNEWRPKTFGEQQDWFRAVLQRLVPIACREDDVAGHARAAIAYEIRGLIRIGLVKEISDAATLIRKTSFWPKGWGQLRQAMYFDGDKWTKEVRLLVNELEVELGPKTLNERFIAFVLDSRSAAYPTKREDRGREKESASYLAEQLGQEVSSEPEIWPDLARQACRNTGYGNSADFGRGLGKKVSELEPCWSQLVSLFGEAEPRTRNPDILRGFLSAANERKPTLVNKWLDNAVADHVLGPHIVNLSTCRPIDGPSIHHLARAVQLDLSPTWQFHNLKLGGRIESTPPDSLATFLEALFQRVDGGPGAAVEILHMYCFGRRTKALAPELVRVGREFILSEEFYSHVSRDEAFGLELLATYCFAEKESEPKVRSLIKMLCKLVGNDWSLGSKVTYLIRQLAKMYPTTVLDVIFETTESANALAEQLFGYTDGDDEHSDHAPVIDDAELLRWVTVNREDRSAQLARYVRYFDQDESGTYRWSAIARALIGEERGNLPVLNTFVRRFHVGSSSGPWHLRLVRRLPLLESLLSHSDPSVQSWVRTKMVDFEKDIESMREHERQKDERFE